MRRRGATEKGARCKNSMSRPERTVLLGGQRSGERGERGNAILIRREGQGDVSWLNQGGKTNVQRKGVSTLDND